MGEPTRRKFPKSTPRSDIQQRRKAKIPQSVASTASLSTTSSDGEAKRQDLPPSLSFVSSGSEDSSAVPLTSIAIFTSSNDVSSMQVEPSPIAQKEEFLFGGGKKQDEEELVNILKEEHNAKTPLDDLVEKGKKRERKYERKFKKLKWENKGLKSENKELKSENKRLNDLAADLFQLAAFVEAKRRAQDELIDQPHWDPTDYLLRNPAPLCSSTDLPNLEENLQDFDLQPVTKSG